MSRTANTWRAAAGGTGFQQKVVYVPIGHVLRDYRIFPTKAKVSLFTLEEDMKTQRGSGGVTLLCP
jgi:hypothetical protein